MSASKARVLQRIERAGDVCPELREMLRARLAGARRRLPTDGEVVDALLARALAAWARRAPGAPGRGPVIERDGYRCAVPGCSSRQNLHDHHLGFRSAAGADAPGNRLTLCAFHHQRCLHAGRVRIRGRAPHGLLFELSASDPAPNRSPATAPATSERSSPAPGRSRSLRGSGGSP